MDRFENSLQHGRFVQQISMANGIYSMAQKEALHSLLNEAMTSLSGWEQGDEESELYFKQNVRDIVFALTGNRLSKDILFPKPTNENEEVDDEDLEFEEEDIDDGDIDDDDEHQIEKVKEALNGLSKNNLISLIIEALEEEE